MVEKAEYFNEGYSKRRDTVIGNILRQEGIIKIVTHNRVEVNKQLDWPESRPISSYNGFTVQIQVVEQVDRDKISNE